MVGLRSNLPPAPAETSADVDEVLLVPPFDNGQVIRQALQPDREVGVVPKRSLRSLDNTCKRPGCAGQCKHTRSTGDVVEARYLASDGSTDYRRTKWYLGRLTGIDGNGNWTLMYADGDKESGVLPCFVRDVRSATEAVIWKQIDEIGKAIEGAVPEAQEEAILGEGDAEVEEEAAKEEEEGEAEAAVCDADGVAASWVPNEGTLLADVCAALCRGASERQEIVDHVWNHGTASTRGDHDKKVLSKDVVTLLGREKHRSICPEGRPLLWTQDGSTYTLTHAGHQASGSHPLESEPDKRARPGRKRLSPTGAEGSAGDAPQESSRKRHAPSCDKPQSRAPSRPVLPPLPALRNDDPRRMDSRGFVELPSLLPRSLCESLDAVSMDRAANISNSRELALGDDLRRQVKQALQDSSVIHDAIKHIYDTDGFVVTAAKVLEAGDDDAPQIPHSDDYCNRELFGIAHVRPHQAPTEAIPYDTSLDHPMGFSAQCSMCKSFVPVPDAAGRRRTYMLDGFCCTDAGTRCGQTPQLSDEESDAKFAKQLFESYSELLLRPRSVVERMRPCGNPEPRAGDGLLCLQTLIHRGPGGRQHASRAEGAGTSKTGRRVLFFTLRPKFVDKRALSSAVGSYDMDGQIHAAWLLWRTKGLSISTANARTVKQMYNSLGHDLSVYGEAGE